MSKTFEEMIERMREHWDRGNIDAAVTVSRIFRVRENFYNSFRPIMDQYDLSLCEFDALASLRKYGPPYELTPSNICQTNLVSSGGLTKVLNSLEDRGLISSKKHAQDQRSRVVKLTKKGQNLIEEALASVFAKNEKIITNTLTKEEREELERLLIKLNSTQE